MDVSRPLRVLGQVVNVSRPYGSYVKLWTLVVLTGSIFILGLTTSRTSNKYRRGPKDYGYSAIRNSGIGRNPLLCGVQKSLAPCSSGMKRGLGVDIAVRGVDIAILGVNIAILGVDISSLDVDIGDEE